LVFGAVAACLIAGAAVSAQTPQAASTPPGPSFTIFFNGTPIGTERIGLQQTTEGWRITGDGRVGGSLNLIIRRLQVLYDPEWRPLGVDLDYSLRGQATRLTTRVTGAVARTEIQTGGETVEQEGAIDPRAVLIPNLFFAPYEAVAAQLRTAEAGSTLSGFVPPDGSLAVTVGVSSVERIQTVERVIEARRTQVTLEMAGAPATFAEIWGDETGRLLRVAMPARNVDAVREDVASVSARRIVVSRDGDEQVRIPGNGFTLAGTLSKPADADGSRLPAVVLVGGSGLVDRDEVVAGIPILGQLAGALADAGFLVLRYDKRGIGQSGGRPEAATLTDYAEDLRDVLRYLTDRDDVDRRRLAAVGYSEGGAVAMIAAEREDRVRALGLVATMGVTGAELNMEQVMHGLERSTRAESEKASIVDLQERIQEAVLTGDGWEEIPEEYRLQADSPWFRSFLEFDPAELMKDIHQPVLIVQPMLDTQVGPSNADRLEELARSRRRSVPVDVVRLPGLNHLLVPATTGEVEEYTALTSREISADVARSIADWLPGAFEAAR
jgi:pimeloyl-ACP methyl ester carboxylesterase